MHLIDEYFDPEAEDRSHSTLGAVDRQELLYFKHSLHQQLCMCKGITKLWQHPNGKFGGKWLRISKLARYSCACNLNFQHRPV